MNANTHAHRTLALTRTKNAMSYVRALICRFGSGPSALSASILAILLFAENEMCKIKKDKNVSVGRVVSSMAGVVVN